MKKRFKSNSGFTLIELIIAMALLAFMMTAVSSFMSSGVLGFKKAKADITVHNSAQETYNQLMDTIMQANDIVIYAYVADVTPLPDGSTPDDTVDFSTSGKDINISLQSDLKCYVRDEAQWNKFKKTAECKDASITPVYFEDIPAGTKLYIVEIIADTAVPIDLAYATPAPDGKYFDAINGGDTVAILQEQHKEKKPDGSYASTGVGVESVTNEIVYNVKDTKRNIFTFEKNKMYYETRYAFMVSLDDYYKGGTDKEVSYLYSTSFSYVNIPASAGTTDNTISGCVATVDPEAGAVGIDLMFSDKNMTYATQGMVNIRNNYVLRPKR